MLYSTFYLGETQMGLPIPSILEIGRGFDFHPVRGAPEVIDGLINLRGKVVTIINTGLAFETQKVLASDESSCPQEQCRAEGGGRCDFDIETSGIT